MLVEPLSAEDQLLLLRLARKAIEKAVHGEEYQPPELDHLSPQLREFGVCFVTLTTRSDGRLRGCIGGLEAVQPLAEDVCIHAAAAAMDDYRFVPVQPDELPDISIDISRLTPPMLLAYENPDDLPNLLHPQVDGVVLRDGNRRATFLPQVWEKIPDPCLFLSQLCQKMGADGDIWRKKKLQVEIYHIEEFRE